MGIHEHALRVFAAVRGALDALLREQLDPGLVRQFAGNELLSTHFVDQHLKGTIADLVARIPLRGGRNAYVYCVIEHKRTQERALALQLLRYQTSLYTWLAKQRRHGEPMPVVAALVVYNGKKPWRIGRSFSELLRVDPALREYTLDFKVHVLDLASAEAANLSKHRALRGGLTALKAATVARRKQIALMRSALDDLAGDHSTVATAVSYFQRIGRYRDLEKVLEDKEEKTRMQTAYQYMVSKGRRQGRKEGLKEGLEKGLEKGAVREQERLRTSLRSMIERLLAKKKLSVAQRKVLATAEYDGLQVILERLISKKPLRSVFSS